MKIKKNTKNINIISQSINSKLNIGGSKKFWNPDLKPYVQKIVKKTCIFDLKIICNVLKQTSNSLFFLLSKEKKILFKGIPKGWELFYKLLLKKSFLTCNKKSSIKKLSLVLGFITLSKEVNKNLLIEIKKKDIPFIFTVNTNGYLKNIDYPLLGNSSLFKNNSLLYILISRIRNHCLIKDKTIWSIKK